MVERGLGLRGRAWVKSRRNSVEASSKKVRRDGAVELVEVVAAKEEEGVERERGNI